MILQRKRLVNTIKTFFDDGLVVLHSPGIANVLMFKHNVANLITLVNVNEDDDLDLAVNTVSKHIINEVKCIDIGKDKYNTRINSEQISRCVSDTLTNLLAKISQKLDRSNPAYMIGNMVTSILKNHPTPLQIALGVLLRESKGLTARV